MEIEKAKLVIAHFLDIDPSQIDQHTLMDHTVIKSSLLLHRMFAALAKEGYLLEDPASIETFGDFEQAISEEIDSPPSIQNSEKEKETHHSNKKEAQSIFSVGIDIEKVSSLEETDDYFNNSFYLENFSFDEIKHCTSRANAQQSFAALFATKEAIIKADNSYKKTKFKNINVSHNELNKPYFKDFSISISHTEDFVVAVAVKLNSNILVDSIKYTNINYMNQNDTDIIKALKILTSLGLGILSIFLILKFL